MLIPIVGPIVLMGWHCEIIQRLVRRHPHPIPKLDFGDFGHYLGRGVVPFLVSFLVSLPMIIALYILIFAVAFGIAVLAQQNVQDFTLIGLGLIGGLAALFLIIIPACILINSFVTFAELTEDFGQSLGFSRVWAYAKRNWKVIFTAQLVFIPISFGMMVAGMAMCYFGIFPAAVMINIAYVNLHWQIYEYDLSRGGPPLPVKYHPILPSEQRAQAAPPPAGGTTPTSSNP
jgi:hypothetical protein